MSNILILGHDGLIGSALRKIIGVNSGEETKIVGISKRDLDFTQSSCVDKIKLTIKSHDINKVIVLAASKRQHGDNKELMHSNNRITQNIVWSLSDFAGHVTYISSCAVYGEKNEQSNANESYLINPTSFYGEHKVYSESLYKSSLDCGKLLLLRPPLIYGPNSAGYDPLGFLKSALTNNSVHLWGEGRELREFVHVYDASRAIAYLACRGQIGTYNLVSGQSYSYREIVIEIQRHIPVVVTYLERAGSPVNHTYRASSVLRDTMIFPFMSPLQVVKIELASRITTNAD